MKYRGSKKPEKDDSALDSSVVMELQAQEPGPDKKATETVHKSECDRNQVL